MRAALRVPGLVLALSIALSSAPALAQDAPAWRVVDEQPIDVDGSPIALSPDGTQIAGTGPNDDFCVWDVTTLDPTCDGDRLGGVIPDSVTWSPDSTAVAFSLDSPRLLVDSDVYVFETSTGTVENLTDDDPNGTGADDIGFGGDNDTPVPIDLYPSWSPDSQQLVFARTIWNQDDAIPGTTLMTLPRAGGDPEELLILAPPTSMIVNGPMTWQDDGTILFGIWKADPEDAQNGIWRTSLDGGLKPVLHGDGDTDAALPQIADVSGDGAGASIVSLLKAYHPDTSGDSYFLLDLDNGTLMPWNDLLGLDADAGTLYAPPTFSPDDRSVAFLTRDPDGAVTLSIADDLGTSAPLITIGKDDGRPAYPPSLTGTGIHWAANDTMLVRTHLGIVLVTLEYTGEATPQPPCGCAWAPVTHQG
jgi:hypothetical protein